MEDEFSHLYQGPGSSPGKAGVSHFRSIQVNNNPTLEQKESSTELQLMPAEYQELISRPSWITETKYLFECTGMKFKNITENRGCWLSFLSF